MRSYFFPIIAFIITLIGFTLPVQAQDAGPISSEAINAYPEPNVQPLAVQDSVLYDRAYRQVEGGLQVHSAPGGTLSNDLGSGYTFVTLAGAGQQGAWAQIGPDQWVNSNALTENVTISRYAGVRLPAEGLPYTMAWTLRHLRPSTTPGGEPSQDNPFLYRYSRVNLYSYVEVDGKRWYQVGVDQWIHQYNVAKIAPVARPADITTAKWVSVDLYEQVLIAYEGDTPVFATLVSSGLPAWSTREGVFNVYVRYERTLMSGAYNNPDFYYLQEVPWTMYFDGDIGLHGTYWHDGFGYRQSHGCVNLSITDAKWLFEWSSDVRDFSVENPVDLGVYVYSSGTYE